MATKSRRTGRPGETEKVSISLDRGDLRALRRRARRLYGGNLSAAVAEGVRRIREEEGRGALVSWLGEAGRASEQERASIRAEWNDAGRPGGSRRRGAR